MTEADLIILCFAVKEEAAVCNRLLEGRPRLRSLLTGIGARNAERAIRRAVAGPTPGLVLSCGFAGGLNPELARGTVVFTADDAELAARLRGAGARPAQFHCVAKVVAAAEEKQMLWRTTGADAVEMESQFICAICRERKIPCATVRVILDAVDEDLPLDFNRFMTADARLNYARLALALMRSPHKIGALLRLRRQAKAAAANLAQVLVKVVPA